MSDKNLPGELYDQLEPGSQSSIALNHFTSNTAAIDNSAASRRHNVAEYVLVIDPGA
jgi:hypothetical protein